ncbi:MAG: hypothetical protein LBH05_09370 [Deferribacteraceae bacterium]|jgi:hypothetical protein|nr:hypothetical protein [Deferribacteraceae bacterium]
MDIKHRLKELLRKTGDKLYTSEVRAAETSLILNGHILGEINASKDFVEDLAKMEFKVFSQWGEDGIIDWLLRQLPEVPEVFIEFGVEDYSESNTRFLLKNRNWRGLVFDSSEKNITHIKNMNLCVNYDLQAKPAFITRENVNSLFSESGITGEIGLLSIDIDGNDYWIWESIACISPAIVVCEYTSHFGDIYPISIQYDPHFTRQRAHYSLQYAGASLPALKHLAAKKGYAFVGTTKTGPNAFFVRDDLFSNLLGKLKNLRGYPSRGTDCRDVKGRMIPMRGYDVINLIKNIPVVNVVSGETVNIGALGELYSDEWRRGMILGNG